MAVVVPLVLVVLMMVCMITICLYNRRRRAAYTQPHVQRVNIQPLPATHQPPYQGVNLQPLPAQGEAGSVLNF